MADSNGETGDIPAVVEQLTEAINEGSDTEGILNLTTSALIFVL